MKKMFLAMADQAGYAEAHSSQRKAKDFKNYNQELLLFFANSAQL
jgi:hypothetical protein